LHSKDFIHRDIKPENFLVGHGKKVNTVFMIDYGLTKRYKCPKTDIHIEHKLKEDVIGTARYASLNAHDCLEQGRRDDLEAVGFVLIFLANEGYLPWMDAEDSTLLQ
jgi:casein kinase 1